MIKVITGIRRSGKSYFLKQIITELKERGVQDSQICFINKESLDFDHIKNYQDLNNYIANYFKEQKQGCKNYIFVDEIQDIEEWEKTLRSTFAQEDSDIYITGSNANLLASELATYLSGRYIEFNIYPLSFKEFLDFRQQNQGSIAEELRLYLRYGGFPALHLLPLNDEAVFPFLRAIYDTVVLKDIVSKYQIRDLALLDRVIKYAMDNLGNIFSANAIAKYLKSQRIKVGVDTMQNYLRYIESSFLLNKALRYDIKGKRYFEFKEKYFLADHGLKNAVLGFKNLDISGILENVVHVELLRRGYKVDVGELSEQEVDFIAHKGEEKLYIQVCYQLNSEETIARELSPLASIADHYPKYLITMDHTFNSKDANGIACIGLADFLLQKE